MRVIQYANGKFGNWLKNKILGSGDSVAAIASKIGVSSHGIRHQILGEVVPTIPVLIKYADYFNTPINELVMLVCDDIYNEVRENVLKERC